MRPFILSLWIMTIVAFILVLIQNQALLISEQTLHINLVLHQFSLPAVPNGLIILFFFIIGALLSYATVTVSRFRARRALKKCRALADGYIDKIGELKTQIDQLKDRCGRQNAGFKPSTVDKLYNNGLPSA